MTSNNILDSYLKRISYKDKDALVSLYMETKTSVYAYALSILKNKSLAEEVMQEVYIKIYENAYLYNSKDKPLSWILTIVKNTSLMKLRKEKVTEDIDLFKEKIGKKDNINSKLFLSYLFDKISKEERDIIILHIVSGFKFKEISTFLNIPLGTVLSKYKRSLSKLKSVAKEDMYEE